MIKTRLLQLPIDIESLKQVDIKESIELEDLIEETKTWELEQLYEIANAVDEKGKAIYSNETKRKAELEQRKGSSSDYQDKQERIKQIEYSRAIRQIKLDRLYNEQGNLRAICRLGDDLDG